MKEKKAIAQDAARDFLRELAILRARVDEGVAQYGLCVKARIDEIMHFLAGTGAPDAGHVLPEPRVQAKMIQRLKKLGQKPQKGRVKDLKRMQDLVDALIETMQGSD
jgi:hypothetical protein